MIKDYTGFRVAIFTIIALFAVSVLLVPQTPLSTPAFAKGAKKTQPKSDSSDSSSSTQQEKPKEEPKSSPPPSSSSPSNSSRDSSSRNDSSSVFNQRDERRDEPREPRVESSPSQRGNIPQTIENQVYSRQERADPEYEYRKHYTDHDYYPYDHKSYSYYPYYDRGSVIIIDRDTWDDSRQRWRRTYDYGRPQPGALEEALVDIEATWWEEEPEFLMWHIDPRRNVDVYYNGKFSHRLSPRQIFKLTADSISRIKTTEFRFTSVDKHGYSAKAKARHEFYGPNRDNRTAYLTYYLEKVRERWIITRIDIRQSGSGSPKCFIATAAFGTPMAREVLVLREFRDSCLLKNPSGRLFVAAYYRISPPIAERITGSETTKAIVRFALKPVIQLCKLATPSEAT